MTIEVPQRDFEMMILSAFRYSLGRTTYMPDVCAGWLEKWWNNIPVGYRRQVQDDIRRAIETGSAGHWCDVQRWGRILELEVE